MGGSSSKIIVYEWFNFLLFIDFTEYTDSWGRTVAERAKYGLLLFVSALTKLAEVYRLSHSENELGQPRSPSQGSSRTLHQGEKK